MIKFNFDDLTVENVRVTAVTQNYGGSVQIVDEDLSEEKGQIVSKRHEVPFAVARAFQKANKQSKFLVPVDVAITRYDGMIVNIELKRLNAIHDDNNDWVSDSDFVRRRILPKSVNDDNWYTDGVTIFRTPPNWQDKIGECENLTSCGRMKALTVTAFKFANMHVKTLMENPATRSCVVFQSKTGPILSPAIWTNVLDIRGAGKGNAKSNDKTNKRFDVLQSQYFVNLEFILSAAKKIGGHFGYDEIGFLELDRHMINLNTVNLPKVSKAVRSTYDAHKPFLICMAWLFGYINRCDNMEKLVAIRGLMKTLCEKGLFDRHSSQKLLDAPPPEAIERDVALVNTYTRFSDLQLGTYFFEGGNAKKMFDTKAVDSAQQYLTGATD